MNTFLARAGSNSTVDACFLAIKQSLHSKNKIVKITNLFVSTSTEARNSKLNFNWSCKLL